MSGPLRPRRTVVGVAEQSTWPWWFRYGAMKEASSVWHEAAMRFESALVGCGEAKHNNQVRRMMARWQRYELIAVDEVGYVPLADVGAEFLFQVISERAEKAVLIVTTNLPFSEWTTVFPSPRLCKALLDGSHYGPGSHYRNGNGVVPLPQNHGKEEEKDVSRLPVDASGRRGKRKVSFLGMSKSIGPISILKSGTKLFPASPQSHRSDEFAIGYSSAVCSPAWPASASPAGFHLQTAGSYLSTGSFSQISKLDSKAPTRQNINVRGGPNQSIEVGQTGVSNSAFCAVEHDRSRF